MVDKSAWTPAMRQYDLRARIRRHVKDQVVKLPLGSKIDVESIVDSMSVMEPYSRIEVVSAVNTVLDDLAEDESSHVTRTDDGGYRMRMAEEYTQDARPFKQRFVENWDWYGSCILVAILVALDVFIRVTGAGNPSFITPTLFGGTLAMSDMFVLCGFLMLILGYLQGRMASGRY